MIDLDLLEQIYEVAIGGLSWSEIAEGLKGLFRSECALLAQAGRNASDIRGLGASGLDPELLPSYGEHFAALDPYLIALRAGTAPLGRAFRGEEVQPDEVLRRTEFYWDWMRPLGLRFTVGAAVAIEDGGLLFLTLPRSPASGGYGEDDVRRCQGYFDHIRRAVEIQNEIRQRRVPPAVDRLAARYRLTPAESRLLELLAETGSLKRAAQRTARSYNTLRAQLRSILEKTSTRSQVQLMRILHGGQGD